MPIWNDSPFPTAQWVGTTAVLPDDTIGFVFDSATGEEIEFALSLEDAQHLMETIAEFSATHYRRVTRRQSARLGGKHSDEGLVPPTGSQRPLDAHNAAFSGVRKPPST